MNLQIDLKDTVEDNDQALVLFYDADAPKIKTTINGLEKLDLSDYPDLAVVKCSDETKAQEFGVELEELPKIIHFDNGIPEEYDANLGDTVSLLKWIKDQLESTETQVLDLAMMEKVVESGSPFVIIFIARYYGIPVK